MMTNCMLFICAVVRLDGWEDRWLVSAAALMWRVQVAVYFGQCWPGPSCRVHGYEGGPCAGATAAAEPTDKQVGSVLDNIIAGDTLVAEISRRVGELRDKAYHITSKKLKTP